MRILYGSFNVAEPRSVNNSYARTSMRIFYIMDRDILLRGSKYIVLIDQPISKIVITIYSFTMIAKCIEQRRLSVASFTDYHNRFDMTIVLRTRFAVWSRINVEFVAIFFQCVNQLATRFGDIFLLAKNMFNHFRGYAKYSCYFLMCFAYVFQL